MKTIYFENIFLSERLVELCQQFASRLVIITDDNVGPLYAEQLASFLAKQRCQVELITIAAGEKSKTRETKIAIEDQMLEMGCGRDTCLIAIGGGVVTDLTGFVAATYCRGIPAIYIPSTVLAMVDAAIGGKTSVNTQHGKNLIGTFTQPKAIFIDVDLLTTLPDDEYRFAFAEILKHALIYDKDYFEFLIENSQALSDKNPELLNQAIRRSCEIKSAVVAKDEKENAYREILNFGHTIAHALEKQFNYTINHGRAVALGLLVESYLSMQLNLLSEIDFEKIKKSLCVFGLLIPVDSVIKVEDLKNYFSLDKKVRKGQVRFVLLQAIGQVFCSEGNYAVTIEEAELDKALNYLKTVNFQKEFA